MVTKLKLLVIKNTESKDDKFVSPLVKAISGLATYQAVNFRKVPLNNFIANNYCGIVLSGVCKDYPFDVADSRLFYWGRVFDLDIPILGICLGHQNIGRFFGSFLFRFVEAEQGNTAIKIVRKDGIFNNIPCGFLTKQIHNGSISLPKDFYLLASSKKCLNQAMRHKKKPIYGMQFHPELSENGQQIIKNFLNIAKQHKLRRGRDSNPQAQ